MAVIPIFLFDDAEKWFPVGVEESLAAVKAKLRGPNGDLPGPLDINRLDKNETLVTRINLPDGMKQPNLPPVGYTRMVERAGLFWHQYWLWYLYNPWAVGGVGKHEGDWEFVQLGCADKEGNKPVLVTYSQHHSGSKREFWAVSQSNKRPIVYVARDSHANYLAPIDNFEDRANGKGKRLDTIEWRPFAKWAEWNGRWGNSTGDGKSPESPGRQLTRWKTPELFHSAAR
jgi:hypothetical protein